ncbi:hypothetical protein ACFQMF_14940 [Halorubrum rutilum]|uniref:Uncharacterized protein n=1 Tax=Halorubrum rutilum TaxID=1364933 RepID=A0ABD6APG5_9EURY
MERYECQADAVDHTQSLLVFSETTSVFGKSFEYIHQEIMSGFEHLDFSLELHTDGIEHVHDLELLVPNSVLLIHYSCIIGDDPCETLINRLEGLAFPKTTLIIIVYDDTAYEVSDTPEEAIEETVPTDEIGPNCLIHDHWKAVVGACELYVKSHSHELHGDAALDAILTWNNQAYDRLYN